MGGIMREITGRTQLTGLIGWPVEHSLSPLLQNAAAASLGLDLRYLPLPVHPNDLGAALAGLPALGFLGVNVTIPHKEAVIPYLDETEQSARAIGAANTIVVERDAAGGRRLVGYNTDWCGFLDDLRALGVSVKKRDCLVLGAGGSARAVAYGLASVGAKVHVFARRVEQAQQLAADLLAHFDTFMIYSRDWAELEQPDEVWPAAALLVNTTPVGMAPHVAGSPWPEERPFPPQAFVYDLIYNPVETRFMRQAAAAGCRTANGLGMLIHQGADAFHLWTGRRPDVAVMREALS